MTIEQELAAWTDRVAFLSDAWIRGAATEAELDDAIEKKRAAEAAIDAHAQGQAGEE